MGVAGAVYAAYDHAAERADELCFKVGDRLQITDRSADGQGCWWMGELCGKKGLVPRNYLCVYPRRSVREPIAEEDVESLSEQQIETYTDGTPSVSSISPTSDMEQQMNIAMKQTLHNATEIMIGGE